MALHRDYRKWLNEIYRSRRSENSKYSIRAFARDLGISSSSMSAVLSFRRHLSKKNAESIAERLSLTDGEKGQLLKAISYRRYGDYDYDHDSTVGTCLAAVDALKEVISKCADSTLVSQKTLAELTAIEKEARLKLRDLLELCDKFTSHKNLAETQQAHPSDQLEAPNANEKETQASSSSIESDPRRGGDGYWKLIAAAAHLSLGHALVLNGELASQVGEFERALELYEICCRKMDPCPADVVVDCCRSLYYLGYAYLCNGNIDLSAPYFERVERYADSILDEEVDRKKKVRCLILAARGLSVYYYEMGDFKASLEQATRMATLAKEGRGLNPENRIFNMAQALSAQLRARSCLRLRKHETASQLASEAVDHLQRLVSNDPVNTHFRRQLAEAQRVLGDVYEQSPIAEAQQRSHCYHAAYVNAKKVASQSEALHDEFNMTLYRVLWARAELEQEMTGPMVEIEEQAIAHLEGFVNQRPSNCNWAVLLLLAKGSRLNWSLGFSDRSVSRAVANDILAAWLPLMRHPEPPFDWVEGFLDHLAFTLEVNGKPKRPEIAALLSKIGSQERFSALKPRVDDLVH